VISSDGRFFAALYNLPHQKAALYIVEVRSGKIVFQTGHEATCLVWPYIVSLSPLQSTC